jgi:DNA-binding MarR family transcriptional regulator
MMALEPIALDAWRVFLNAHAAVVERIEAALAEAELPPLGWYDVLWALYRAPEQKLRMHELAPQVVLSRSGLVRLVDRVEGAGLVARERCLTDRRGAFAVLTPDGEAMLRRMLPVYEQAICDWFATPVGDGAQALADTLTRVQVAAR